MQISHEERGDISLFRVIGDIDINSSPEVKKAFFDIYDESGNRIDGLSVFDSKDQYGSTTEPAESLSGSGVRVRYQGQISEIRKKHLTVLQARHFRKILVKARRNLLTPRLRSPNK